MCCFFFGADNLPSWSFFGRLNDHHFTMDVLALTILWET
jgi:hypothetical protein